MLQPTLIPTESPYAQLLGAAAGRITFMMSLDWDSGSDSFSIQVEDDFLILRESFKVGDSTDPWLNFEAKAPNDLSTASPHIEVCVKFPWCFTGKGPTELILSKVNQMNLANQGCSTCFEAERGQIAIRSRIGFAGYNNVDEPQSEVAHIQEEITLNMFSEVMSMAIGWNKHISELYARL